MWHRNSNEADLLSEKLKVQEEAFTLSSQKVFSRSLLKCSILASYLYLENRFEYGYGTCLSNPNENSEYTNNIYTYIYKYMCIQHIYKYIYICRRRNLSIAREC